MDSGSEGVNIFMVMVNERLESALAWCKKNDIESTRLKKFNRESKKKRLEKKQNKPVAIKR
ncbi:hypothetical protein ES705_37670 [subsurface metagenome]